MNNLSSDNSFIRIFSRLGNYLALSFCWLLCCIPLITIGSATIALYDAVAHCLRDGEDNAVKHYFGTFKKVLLRGILLTVLWVGISYFLMVSYQILCQLAETGGMWSLMQPLFLCTLLLPVAVLCWLVPLQGRFSLRFPELHITALSFAITHLPQTLAVSVILIVGLILLSCFPILLILLPAAMAHLQSVFIEKCLPDEL